MKEHTLERLERFIQNRNDIKTVFPYESSLVHLACSSIYTMKDKAVDLTVLQSCKEMIKQKVGVFSSFRSTARELVLSLIALSENPQHTLERSMKVYQELKKEFRSSPYLPLASVYVQQMAEDVEYEDIVKRTSQIYHCMKTNHPFLTSSEDCTFCALMALSEQSRERLLDECEHCYRLLKSEFFSSNAVQTLSHVLALLDGTCEQKCRQTLALYEKLKRKGCNFGVSYELPILGILANSCEYMDEMVEEIIQIDSWLSKQKGFGLLSGISQKQRLMYAGLLALRDCVYEVSIQTATMNGTISLLIAQQAAMCAAVAAASVAATNCSAGT